MTRIVQIRNGSSRVVALVDEPHLRALVGHESVRSLAQAAVSSGRSLRRLIDDAATGTVLDYDAIYDGRSKWQLLPPIDHPEPARCLVSGTGLTHLGSAEDRHAMHGTPTADETDSMRIFRWGVERGRPAPGEVGVAPEWFYKGSGAMLRAHGAPLVVPAHGEDGGEEAEIAGVYVIDDGGRPWRIGMCNGNEFSDHRFEKRNYLNLAGSKLRTCSLGPELAVDPDFRSVQGTAAIERDGAVVWSKRICTGELEMCHSLQNVEHHHFKFEPHRRPGDVHVHYFGACSLSFGHIELAEGDVMCVEFDDFGRPLRNPLAIDASANALVTVGSLA